MLGIHLKTISACVIGHTMSDNGYDAREIVQSEERYSELYGFNDALEYKYSSDKGLTEKVVKEISGIKLEPEWMLQKRLDALRVFLNKPMPRWGADLSGIDFDSIRYYMKPTDKKTDSWENVPEGIKKTFDKLGVPEAERKFFAGGEAQYDSEVVYSSIRKDL